MVSRKVFFSHNNGPSNESGRVKKMDFLDADLILAFLILKMWVPEHSLMT